MKTIVFNVYVHIFPNKKRKVYQFDLEGNFIAEYKNATEAAKSLGKRNSAIINCCNKKTKTSYGYIWSYEKVDYLS